jgi:hypothetical protein
MLHLVRTSQQLEVHQTIVERVRRAHLLLRLDLADTGIGHRKV